MTQETRDRELFDRIAERYAQKDVYPPSRHARAFQLRSLIDRVRPFRGDDPGLGHVLEIGCGSGAAAEYLRGEYETYTGLDYSEGLVRIATARHARDGVRFLTANVKELDGDGPAPDLIFGVGVLHHVTDYRDVFDALRRAGHAGTLYGFIEPQRGNPLVGLMRRGRQRVDKEYSEEQRYFTKAEVRRLFDEAAFEVLDLRSQGYLTPPLAQVMLKPKALFMPLSRAAAWLDGGLQRALDSRLAWNLTVVARRR